jgi:hypothetical protein
MWELTTIDTAEIEFMDQGTGAPITFVHGSMTEEKLPAVTWEQLLDGLEIEQRSAVLGQVKGPEVTVDKRLVKAAIDGGVDVPGASLAIGRHSLRRS